MVNGIVRDAGVADVEMIASTYVAASVAAFGRAASLEAIQAAADGAHAMWRPVRRPGPGQWMVVVDTPSGPTGFASFGAVDTQRGHLYALYVDPGSWGMGLGSLLLEAALARLRESAVDRVELWLQLENVRANPVRPLLSSHGRSQSVDLLMRSGLKNGTSERVQQDGPVEFLPLDHTDPSVAEELLRVQRRAYAVEAELIEFEAIPNLDEAVDDIRQLRLSITAAMDTDGIIGFTGHTRTGGLVEIDRLAVDPASFRRGIGRALLQHLHDAEPDAEFVVSTPARNTPAVELYMSAGYHVEYRTVVAGTLPILGFRRLGRDRS